MSHQTVISERKRLKRILAKTEHGFRRGAYFDEDKNRIIRYWESPIQQFFDRYANRRFRHKALIPAKGADFKRIGGRYDCL